jgi:hypothetical protein
MQMDTDGDLGAKYSREMEGIQGGGVDHVY